MNNPNDPIDDEKQLITPVSDYRTLLETTRPLVIAKDTPLSSKLAIYRDQVTWLETGDCHREFVLKRGEIVYPDLSQQRVTNDEGLPMATALRQTSSNPIIRIYIGMS